MSEGVEEEDVPVIYLASACLYDLNGPREGSDEVFNPPLRGDKKFKCL